MNPRTTIVAAAVAAALLNIAFIAPALAQVKAALTRDVDRSSAQPVSGVCKAAVACALYKVPAGKRLVVETVGYHLTTASGSVVYLIAFGTDNGTGGPVFDAPNSSTVAPALAYDRDGYRVYSGSQNLTMHFDEHQGLAAFSTQSSNYKYEQIFRFSGYLVDK